MPDYQARMSALRALAEHASTPEHERALAREKLAEMEAKHGNFNSRATEDTTVTGADGRHHFFYPTQTTTVPPENVSQAAWDALWNLYHNQYQWNRPPADEADLVEEGYETDEDAGYDIYEGGEYDNE
jgi:hypothetical protein